MIKQGAGQVLTAAGLLMLTTACATATSSRFVKKGDSFVEVAAAPGGPAATVSPAEWERARLDALAARALEPRKGPRTVEEVDAALGAALASLKSGQSVQHHLAVADHYNRLRVHDLAYDHLSRALALEPKSATALDGRARLLRDVGLLGMALSDVHRALYIAPDSAAVRNTLGTILERLGQCREAVTAYREAVRLSNAAPWAQKNAARLSTGCPG